MGGVKRINEISGCGRQINGESWVTTSNKLPFNKMSLAQAHITHLPTSHATTERNDGAYVNAMEATGNLVENMSLTLKFYLWLSSQALI